MSVPRLHALLNFVGRIFITPGLTPKTLLLLTEAPAPDIEDSLLPQEWAECLPLRSTTLKIVKNFKRSGSFSRTAGYLIMWSSSQRTRWSDGLTLHQNTINPKYASFPGLCFALQVQSASPGPVIRSPTWAMAEQALTLDETQMLEGCWPGRGDVFASCATAWGQGGCTEDDAPAQGKGPRFPPTWGLSAKSTPQYHHLPISEVAPS